MNKELKLVTYNLRNGLNVKRLAKNVVKMASRGADLFCFQEFRKFKERPFVGERLRAVLGEEWTVEYFLKENTFDLGLCVMWKKSKLDLVKAEKIMLPKISQLKMAIRILERLFFERRLPVQRGVIIADFKMGNALLRVSNVHLDWIGGLKHKTGQLQYLIDCLTEKPKTDYEIVCGDFNTVGPLGLTKRRHQKMFKTFEGKFVDVSSGLRVTSHTLQKLDYIFSRGFKEVSAERLFFLGSDHMPLLAHFHF